MKFGTMGDKSALLVVVILSLSVGVLAYQSDMYSGNPSVVGHSAGEVTVQDSSGQLVSLQEELDSLEQKISAVSEGDNSILSSCQICRRYADNNGRASATWKCVGIEQPLITDFAGDVDGNDDFDLKITCTDANIQSSYKLCRRYADQYARQGATWDCANFGAALLTDFAGNVNEDDRFDLVIAPKQPGEIRTSCGLCRRYADHNGRARAPWACATIQHPVHTNFVGDVDGNDDFDLKLSCNILFEQQW